MPENTVWEIKWTETGRGWEQRPDGFTYHTSAVAAKQYVDQHWALLPYDSIPDCYSYPGNIVEVQVEPVFAMLVHGTGLVRTNNQVPHLSEIAQ